MRNKYYVIVVVLLLLAMVFVACKKSDETAAETPVVEEEATTEEEAEPVVEANPYDEVVPATNIVFWHPHSGDREVALQELVTEFMALPLLLSTQEVMATSSTRCWLSSIPPMCLISLSLTRTRPLPTSWLKPSPT